MFVCCGDYFVGSGDENDLMPRFGLILNAEVSLEMLSTNGKWLDYEILE